jgi:hypothetical protein
VVRIIVPTVLDVPHPRLGPEHSKPEDEYAGIVKPPPPSKNDPLLKVEANVAA